MRRLVFLALALATGCSDALEQKSTTGQVIGVVNGGDRTLSLISATDFTVSTRDWQRGSATPRTIDGRGSVFLVPLGQADAVAVDRLLGPCGPGALCVQPDYVLALASGSGATGVAIQDDSIAWIANPNLNTVTRLKDRKSTRLNSSHGYISYAVFCLKKKKENEYHHESTHYEICA